ncbi:reverse transcriptase [Lasius niger]|uniref:Reverse transcriptase n=1 Tax=Lasius niger TaxID=67767 RepID=A0A0J7JYQ3_LASNI|nr:reverse transcriptase [Lasius niger]
MSYHMTQVFTGHGCFSKFLHRIGKKEDTSCFFCGEEDDAIHTIRDCPMWDPQRIDLKRKLGLARDFTLGDIVESIVGSRDLWSAFSAFVQEAMREKEEEEKRLERERARVFSSSSIGDDEFGLRSTTAR